MLENRQTINVRTNRFKNPKMIVQQYEKFDFNNNIKSDHIKELEFTNFVKTNTCKKYCTLLDICKKINNNEKEWDKLFVADEIDINVEIPKLHRLYKILNAVNNKEINRKELILKFKYIEDKEIQFYIKKENETLKLYLIYLYHIGIEAVNRKIGIADRKKIYRARKECKCDIKEIQNELNNNTDKP